MGMGHLQLNGLGIYGLNGWGSYGKVAVLFGNVLKKCWSSDHRTTIGFGPFELPTCGLIQRGQDHSSPKGCFILRSTALGWPS